MDRFARRFLDLAGASAKGRTSEPTIAEMREGLTGLAAFAGATPGVRVDERDERLPGGAIPIRIYSPAALSQEFLPGLIYFHGGGWLSGDLASHGGICRALAAAGQCRVIAVDYRLAPEHRFPAAIEDCLAAVEIINAQPARFGLDPARIGVAGDSAGGNLAVVICQLARKRGLRIALQVLLCPVMDALGRTQSRQALGTGYFLEERTMIRYWEHYRIEGLDPDNSMVSPSQAIDFHDLPPALIHTAEYDPLSDEGALYAVALARAGVEVHHCQHPGMIHHFYGLGAAIPYAATALAAIGAEIREAFA
ncbi:alpha/beta hydrolase [Methylocapsa sp. S129]|uniref:alpha/beta hydrolase n=1 Tax=Methylocapsa sp. S129 TaxID=1641869 RepID=UPI00131E7113|nr:alpha/beta hydrolase [Methylocapsa sp. S129]